MKFKHHQLTGIATALAVSFLTGRGDLSFWVLTGSTLPDVDAVWGMGKRKWWGHRGITHSVALWGLVALTGWLLGKAWLVFLAIGCGVHLLMDAFSPSGVSLLFGYNPRLRLAVLYRTVPYGKADPVEVMLAVTYSVAIILIAFTLKKEYILSGKWFSKALASLLTMHI